MLLNRVDVNLQPRQGVKFGKAAALYRAPLGFPPVTFVLTTRCNISCAHCYSPRPATPIDLDPDLAKATADELRGMDRLYFSGGEPFQYFADQRDLEQRFMDLVHYVAARVERLYIDTNGSFLPSDLAGAISYLTQFPNNTTFVLSVDRYHADALARQGKSLRKIFEILSRVCQEQDRRLELNSRFSAIDNPSDRDRNGIARFLGVDPASLSSIAVHANSILAQGAARKLPGAKPVRLSDFIEHLFTIKGIGLFVTPTGLVTSGDHAAFLSSPPSIAILGDLHSHTLAHIIREKLSCKRPPVPPNEIAAMVRDDSLLVNWQIDSNLDPEIIQQVMSGFAKDKMDEVLGQLAIKLIDSILETEKNRRKERHPLDRRTVTEVAFAFLAQKAKLTSIIVPITVYDYTSYNGYLASLNCPPSYLTLREHHAECADNDSRYPPNYADTIFTHFWQQYEKYFGFPEGRDLRLSFLNAMNARLTELIPQTKDSGNSSDLQILLIEVKKQLDKEHLGKI